MSQVMKVLGFDEKLIDREKGASAAARNAVGGAPNPQDRLATLKKYYPDAQPYGNNNFLFTEPSTGRPTLYNEEGLSVGDVASVTPEIMEMVGGAAGLAAALNPVTVASTGGASVLTAPLAYGFGAAGGREFENLVATQLAERTDTREPHERLIDTALTTTMNATAQKYGQHLSDAIGAFGTKFRKATDVNLADFRVHKIEPVLSAVHAAPFVQNLEQGLSTIMASSDVIINAANRTVRQIGQAVDNLAAKYGPADDVATAGVALMKGGDDWRKAFLSKSEDLYRTADNALNLRQGTGFAMPFDEPIDLSHTLNAMNSTVNLFKSNPELGKELTGSQILKWGKLLEEKGTLGTWEEVKMFRTIIGEKLSNPQVIENVSKKHLKAIYKGLSEDMEAYAARQGPDALKAFRRANDHFAAGIKRTEIIKNSLDEKFASSPEQLFNLFMGATKAGTSRENAATLQAYKRSVPPERWDHIVTTIVRGLGDKTPGKKLIDDPFSVNTFMTNWHKMSPRAKDIIFSGNRYKDLRTGLDEITRIADRLKRAEGYANVSNTARNLNVMIALSVLGGSGGLAVGGQEGGAAGVATTMGALLLPRAAAKLITSPNFIRALADGSRVNMRNPNSVSTWIAKFANVAEVEPEIRQEIQSFLEAFRPTYQRLNQKTDTPFATEQQEQQ